MIPGFERNDHCHMFSIWLQMSGTLVSGNSYKNCDYYYYCLCCNYIIMSSILADANSSKGLEI